MRERLPKQKSLKKCSTKAFIIAKLFCSMYDRNPLDYRSKSIETVIFSIPLIILCTYSFLHPYTYQPERLQISLIIRARK